MTTFRPSTPTPQGDGVQQRLRGVALAVAGVDDGGAGRAGHSAMSFAAPDAGCRTTMASAPMASRVRAVSLRLSPFFTDDEDAEMLITSALTHCRGLKDARVRVEFS